MFLLKTLRALLLFFKKISGRNVLVKHTPLNFDDSANWPISLSCKGSAYINDLQFSNNCILERNQVFPLDNTVSNNIKSALNSYQNEKQTKTKISVEFSNYIDLWNYFVEQAQIQPGWRYSKLYYAGYSLPLSQYILPSWLWTNGKVVEHLVTIGQNQTALNLAKRLLELQLDFGGWVVRYDYRDTREDVSPVIAPNDSAYCANHGLLSAFRLSGDPEYLSGAERCADWIMSEGHHDYLILHSYNFNNEKWDTGINIIDIGFAAGLFCSLYELTHKEEYLKFAGKFLSRYIDVFYLGKGIFATSIVNEVHYSGKGIFARGLAWALEGLIPYYELTGDPFVGTVIEETVSFLLSRQHGNGAWLYNLRSDLLGYLSGYDNKGIPVIAASLSRWKKSRPERAREIDAAVLSSVEWCMRNTRKRPLGTGGIFSPNIEGAIVHSPNTEVSFVYSNCYMIRLVKDYGLDCKI